MEFFSSSPAKKPCFIEEEEEDELVALADMEAGISGDNENSVALCNLYFTKRNSSSNFYNYDSFHSPRSVRFSGRFHDSRFGSSRNLYQPHFLDSCHLCKKPLGYNRDIFMYRGDTPFCSEECRQEEIDRDEIQEKKQSLSSSVKAMRRKEQRSSSTPAKSSKGYRFRSGTVAAA